MNVVRIPRQLILGENYKVWWGNSNEKVMICKFIQPTRKGFNLLNIKTNKCILRHHLYPSKKEGHESGDYFFTNSLLHSIKIEKKIVL